MRLARLALCIGLFCLAGCQTATPCCQIMIYGAASELEKLSVGMSKEQVIEILGHPVSTSADSASGEEYLLYKKMKYAISEWPRTYLVTLQNGKVTKWVEQADERNITY